MWRFIRAAFMVLAFFVGFSGVVLTAQTIAHPTEHRVYSIAVYFLLFVLCGWIIKVADKKVRGI